MMSAEATFELLENVISPREEMIAYESICGAPEATQKSVAEMFQKWRGKPSEVFESLASLNPEILAAREVVERTLLKLSGFSVCVKGMFQFPAGLSSARYPLELFYYRGYIQLAETPCISIVGARKASEDGIRRAQRLSRELVSAGYTIVSGLALGIDTAAMTAAIGEGGNTIGVIGTPINEVYPKENAALQEKVAREHLLISQVPFHKYKIQPFKTRKYYFPQRNETMAALSRATVIVEASDTSGSLTQARAAIQQGRQLFILNSCFENKKITWPSHYEKLGAIRIKSTDEILDKLGSIDGNLEQV